MKPAEVLLSVAGVLLAGSIILVNPAAGVAGAAIIAYYSMARLSFSPRLEVLRRIPQRGTELEPLLTEVEAKNLSEASGYLVLRETSPDIFARPLKAKIRPREHKKLMHTLIPQKKGVLKPEAKAEFIDMTGLFRAEVPVSEEREITVFPSQRRIREALTTRKEPNAFAEARSALGLGLEVLDFDELREFLPGDDVRKIDWKASSRLNKLIVKVFKREALSEVYLLINVDPSFRREMRNRKTDYLTLIIAQTVAYFQKFGHIVGAITYDSHSVRKVLNDVGDPARALAHLEISPQPGRPQITPSPVGVRSEAARKILKIKSGTSTSGIEKAALRVPSNSYVLIIDDVGLHPGEIIAAVKILKRKGSNVAVLYPNPIRFLRKDEVSPDELEGLYSAYRARKELLRKMRTEVPVVELGPKDVFRKVVERL
ncbi:DUF58 domain-containing protein [Thermococcus peptonophilus]|uniref:ATPase n=1 Tax=Thermococcus peptonophilus TaxID=53952 RepID=A0A142CVP1_9EURY|nr:DUF58 domain-containing protein [Thermococcus peptonophilus]AMQ18843.1 ATPase [Thermococcus peptonophilus]